MPIHKLTSTDAFVAFDLDDAPAAGIVRSAPKILQGGASDLARSLTYAFATFGVKRGGASAGINAKPDECDAATAAFAAELVPMASEGRLALDAGKGVPADALAELRAADDRSSAAELDVEGDPLTVHLGALGPVIAAEKAAGGLDGKSVSIEGFSTTGPALAAAVAARGAKIVGVSTSRGMRYAADGLDAGTLRAEWDANGDGIVGDDPAQPWKIFGVDADILFVGSKAGALTHEGAESLSATVVVPHTSIPFTARALAVANRRGVTMVADFIPTAAPIFAWWPAGADDAASIIATATDAIVNALDETSNHADGGFLGACYRAEAFLATWQDKLPFGRPLAS